MVNRRWVNTAVPGEKKHLTYCCRTWHLTCDPQPHSNPQQWEALYLRVSTRKHGPEARKFLSYSPYLTDRFQYAWKIIYYGMFILNSKFQSSDKCLGKPQEQWRVTLKTVFSHNIIKGSYNIQCSDMGNFFQ